MLNALALISLKALEAQRRPAHVQSICIRDRYAGQKLIGIDDAANARPDAPIKESEDYLSPSLHFLPLLSRDSH